MISSPAAARRRRRRAIVGFQLRVVGLAIAGVLAAFIAIAVIKKTLHPYVLGHEEGARIALLQAHLAHQNKLNDDLDRKIKYMQSEEGREAQARHKGYHLPGEVVYLLDDPANPSTTPASTATPAPPPAR